MENEWKIGKISPKITVLSCWEAYGIVNSKVCTRPCPVVLNREQKLEASLKITRWLHSEHLSHWMIKAEARTGGGRPVGGEEVRTAKGYEI